MPRARARLPAPYLPRRHWTIDVALSALSAWDASGISMLAFADREGLDVRRLYRWRRRLSAESFAVDPAPASAPEFVELRPRGAEPLEIVLRSGRVLRVSETVDPSALVRIIVALERSELC
jgi:hypothetical protein